MVSLLPTKFHEILFSSFRGVALTNCVTDRRTDRQDKNMKLTDFCMKYDNKIYYIGTVSRM